MMTRRKIVKEFLVGLALTGILFALVNSGNSDEVTSGSSGGSEQSTTAQDFSGLVPALLKETITKKIEEMEKSNQIPPEHPHQKYGLPQGRYDRHGKFSTQSDQDHQSSFLLGRPGGYSDWCLFPARLCPDKL